MSEDREVLQVRILDKEYTISCLPDERESLIKAARELNGRMRDMRDDAKVLGGERMAVMAALNVIHEREQIASKQGDVLGTAQGLVDRLATRLDAVIDRRE